MRVPRGKIFLYRARDFVGQHVYPVHRLDAGTSGVLLMALDSKTASRLAQLFQGRQVEKTYHAVVRGWAPDDGVIDVPLDSDLNGAPIESWTSYKRLGRIEIPEAVGRRHATARYSWLEVSPRTGRYHQIRRHLNRIAHPILGDAVHGDSHHNRFFRERLGLGGLCLKAHRLRFRDGDVEKTIEAPTGEKWENIAALFGGPFKA